MSTEENKKSLNFIEQIIEKDIADGNVPETVYTRFPPEPNGYLHLGHSQSIWLNFTLGEKYGGKTNLRFDDTNPSKEEQEYVDAIQEDINWLGFDWDGEARFTSDYFDQLFDWAVLLIKKGKAYIDDSTFEEIQEMRGDVVTPGTNSPYRERTVEENLDLFNRMKAGEFEEGTRVLRAKIDMTAPNMFFRDPVLYRIMKVAHHRTGDKWCIYPMYDFAHGQSDAIEGISHSICTLEFENHRPLYNWFLREIGVDYKPKQREFARLNVNYTVMSKRKLLRLVQEGLVTGWDDPRMPTISALRRRGYTPKSIKQFCEKAGISKRERIVDIAMLEFCVREDLNAITNRMMAVLDPIKVTIANYPEGKTEIMTAVNNPNDEASGTREIPFSKVIYIERNDFMEDAPKKYFRLKPEGLVRLKNAYIIQCDEVLKDADGNVTELVCSYNADSKSGEDTSGLKVKGTIHWVSAEHAKQAEVRVYDRLFSDPNPLGHEDKDFVEFINPDSLSIIENALIEPALAKAKVGDKVQFMRKGYYCVDKDSTPEKLVFNLTVGLRDSWAKMQKKK
ncbi:UNVERIFIED_CONTAM: hypothetical protein GTU68_045106 [Idotea baltica]|nr:hypothetical protein [Idotea baltica]